jgi:heavy metal translocating P-type ATPase
VREFLLAVAVAGLAYALWTMLASLRQGRVGVDVIAVLALGGALAVGEFLAAAVISVMLASGRLLEAWAARRAQRDLSELLARAPRTARRYRAGTPGAGTPSGATPGAGTREASELEIVPLAEVTIGDVLLVTPGDVVPVDGTVTQGSAILDESALTGEAVPVERAAGDAVRSGVLNAGGPFGLRATTSAADSTYAGIVRLVSEAQSQQAPFVRLADRYALWFLPLTLAVAGLAWLAGGPDRAVAVLVVATPCPLILAAPVAIVSGLAAAARRGVVVKNGGVLERLAGCRTLLLDKTGTLTVGNPVVTEVIAADPCALPPAEILRLAASLDQVSGHVLASAIVSAAVARGLPLTAPGRVTEIPGEGIKGHISERFVVLGRATFTELTAETPAWARTARRRARIDGALTVFISVDGRPAGALLLEDRMRPDARATIRALRRGGITRIVLATGDRTEVADAIGALAGVDEVLAGLTPEGKLAAVRAQQRHAPVIMTGDGINDAPALALADVGVAMGARGATASSEAADAVLTVDRLGRLGDVAAVARRTRRIALESVFAGMGMSLAAMGIAAAGLLPAVWGALLQEAIDVAVVLNALRALRLPSAATGPGAGSRSAFRGTRRVRPADVALTQRFRDEHEGIRDCIDLVGAAADALTSGSPAAAMPLVRHAYELLVSQVWPHEHAEESQLYPMVDRLVGGADPTAPMSRAHAEIAHQIARLGRLLEDIGDDAHAAEADAADLRGLLYGLAAILRLHTTQEDETYLSLDEVPNGPGGTGLRLLRTD